jgi:hypothetical protein
MIGHYTVRVELKFALQRIMLPLSHDNSRQRRIRKIFAPLMRDASDEVA